MNISTFGGADPFHKREVNMKFPRNRMLSIKSLLLTKAFEPQFDMVSEQKILL
jgi:hypothetical protein